MQSKKNKFYIPIVLSALFFFISISCKDGGITEPQPSILTKETIEKLQAATDKIMMNKQTPGMMAYISVEGEGELYIARGVSNLVTNEPMNVNGYFRIGSITKTFTSEAVLILADEGRIDLNKSISSYLPDLKIPSGDKITIRMLGNMTSGLFDYTSDMNFWNLLTNSNGQAIFTPEKLLDIAFTHPIQFEPGTKYNYCNTNYILLGLLIKKVTGKEVIDVFNEKMFQPLGMKNTLWPNTSYLPYPYIHGYSSLVDVTNWSPSGGDAAGILISNFSDLKIWAKELNERNLLSNKMKNERTAWIASTFPGFDSGFGLEKYNDWVGKDGSIPGYNAEVWYYPSKKITMIINSNSWEGDPALTTFFSFVDILTPTK
ncbi:MAG: serine hydrolase domain-containing protein [Ignavibacteriaceae bacterium]